MTLSELVSTRCDLEFNGDTTEMQKKVAGGIREVAREVHGAKGTKSCERAWWRTDEVHAKVKDKRVSYPKWSKNKCEEK